MVARLARPWSSALKRQKPAKLAATRAAPAPKPRPARKADRVVDRVPEWKLQAAVCAELSRRGVVFAAGLEGVRLSKRQRQLAALTGMQAGETDLRIYRPNARLVSIELKAEGGRLNAAQKDRHALLRSLGFEVHTVKATTEAEAVRLVLDVLGLA